jgi:hypothetical protein
MPDAYQLAIFPPRNPCNSAAECNPPFQVEIGYFKVTKERRLFINRHPVFSKGLRPVSSAHELRIFYAC